MQSTISFVLDGKIVRIDFGNSRFQPTTTVLNYLRSLPNHKGVKEGCAEGDCGACTVVLAEIAENGKLRYRAVNSCLVFLPMIHGKQLITAENLTAPDGKLHPVQQALVESHATQCGFCTPGIVMSLFALHKNTPHPNRNEITEALSGNLCRCTGYQPIVTAGFRMSENVNKDHFAQQEKQTIKLLRSIGQESLEISTDRQRYFRPVFLEEALQVRARLPEAILVSGATDVALRVTKEHERLPAILDIGAVKELERISETESEITLGTTTRIEDLMPVVEKHFPALHSMFTVYGSKQIRELATLGGNLGTASPIGDSAPVLMAYNASLRLQNRGSVREVALDDFFTGYRQTALQPGEIITAVKIPRLKNGALVKSYKISRRRELDISTLSGGFRLELENNNIVKRVKLAYGGMAEVTKRAVKTESFLLGKRWSRQTVENAMPLLAQDFHPIDDVRGSAEFRRLGAQNLLMKFFEESREW